MWAVRPASYNLKPQDHLHSHTRDKGDQKKRPDENTKIENEGVGRSLTGLPSY